MRRPQEERARRPDLDDAPAVHHGDLGRQRRDDGEVVADVDGGDAVRLAQVAHGREHVRLRRDVEPRRRLVEDDHARPVRERHRERDALLLAAGELVRIPLAGTLRRSGAAPRPAPRRCARGARRSELPKPCSDSVSSSCFPIRSAGLSAERGILRDVRDELAAQPLSLEPWQSEDVRGPRSGPPRRRSAAPRRVWPSTASAAVVFPEPDSPTSPSTSPAGTANETSSTMSMSVALELDAEVLDLESRRRHSARLPTCLRCRSTARANPSPMRLVAIVSRPIATTGRTTGQGWSVSPLPVLVDHETPVGGSAAGCRSRGSSARRRRRC